MHPNVVTTYHYDITPVSDPSQGMRGVTNKGAKTDWRLYLVQEYCSASLQVRYLVVPSRSNLARFTLVCPGQDALRNRLLHKSDSKAPDLDLILSVLMDIARGMIYIHSKNIIHGEILVTACYP